MRRCLWNIGLLVLTLLLLAACTPKEQTPAESGTTVRPVGTPYTVYSYSSETLPSGTSQAVRDWLEECDARTHLTDAVLFTVENGVCEALLYCTDLERAESYRSEYAEGVLYVHAQSTDGANEGRTLLYVSFPEATGQPRIKLLRDGESVGLLLTRCGDAQALSAFRVSVS